MMRRILVPLDGSAEAETILPCLRRLASTRSEVHLLHVVPEVHAPVGQDPTHRLTLHDQGAHYLAATREHWLPDQPGMDLVRAGDPGEGILAAALEKNIDLIAMTTHGRSGLKRVLFGSVASKVVRASQLPVLLTRPDILGPAKAIRRVLLAVEGMETPKELLETVRTLVPEPTAEIVLFQARTPVKDSAPQWALQSPLTGRSLAETHLQGLADSLEEKGLYAWPVVSTGDPAEEIVLQSQKLDADLIAMSTHGREGLERILEGSVAERVLRHSYVPVLLQKPLVVRKPILLGGHHG